MLRAVIQAGEMFENPRSGTRLEVRESTPQRVVFDRRYPPHTGRADPHVHFDLTQSWEVLAGEARTAIDGETRDLGPGERVEIATGVPHQDIHNPHDAELTVRWTVAPVKAQSWITRLPIPLQKVMLPAGAWIGRLRGYRPRYS